MSTKIQLTPSELLAQSTEMKSLQADYDNLFGAVNGILTGINSSWSPNLSNNFTGKIDSARSAFSTLLELLTQGAGVAESSANAYENMDNALAKVISGVEGAANAAGTAATGSSVADNLAGSWERIKEVMKETKGVKSVSEIIDALGGLEKGGWLTEQLSKITDTSIFKSLNLFKDLEKLNSEYHSGDVDGFHDTLTGMIKGGLGTLFGLKGLGGKALVNIGWNLGENFADVDQYAHTDNFFEGLVKYECHVIGDTAIEGVTDTAYDIVDKVGGLFGYDVNKAYEDLVGKSGTEGVKEAAKQIYGYFSDDFSGSCKIVGDAFCDWGKDVVNGIGGWFK